MRRRDYGETQKLCARSGFLFESGNNDGRGRPFFESQSLKETEKSGEANREERETQREEIIEREWGGFSAVPKNLHPSPS